MIKLLLPVLLVGVLSADTSSSIADIYDDTRYTDHAQEYLDKETNTLTAPTIASKTLMEASQHAEIAAEIADEENSAVLKLRNAIGLEAQKVVKAADATAKYSTIKFLHFDLLSAIVRQDLLYQEIKLLQLNEAFSASIEEEFK